MNARDLERIKLYEQSMPYASVTFRGEKLAFAVPNEKCLGFAASIEWREPDTIDWLGDLSEKDVFFDVGANNLVFSLIAAKFYKTVTYAFEPHFASYHISQLNVFANNLQNLITVYPLALTSEVAVNRLYLSDVTAGKSLNSFGVKSDSTDPLKSTKAMQGSVAMSLDTICSLLDKMPTVLKIDVDGLESNIIAGALKVLQSSSIRKLMVEFDPSRKSDLDADNRLSKMGYVLDFAGPSGYFYRRREL